MSVQPTILFITCDELRRDALSCYGGRAISTPNIDSLMDNGTFYDNCYTVSPLCLPARCSMLTGLYPHNSGAYSNFRKCPLNQNVPNLFTQLKTVGYSTSLIGKCHFAPVPYDKTRPDKTLPYDDFKEYYMSLGIDYLELQDDKQVSIWYYDDYSKELDRAGYLKEYRDNLWNPAYGKVFPFPGPIEWHPDAWVGDHAVKFLKQNAGTDKPQFLWVSFSGPHYPFDAPQEYYSRVNSDGLPKYNRKEGEYKSQSRIHHKSYYGGGCIDGCGPAPEHACKNYTEDYWKRLQISYYANMALIDDKVGEILDVVQTLYGENVLIIFTADHGEMLGNHGLWGKHDCAYDDVWRVPMLIHFPGQTERCVENGIINLTDIFPTCLKAGGIEEVVCDGTALQDRDTYLSYTFCESEGFCAVTDGTYKYVHVQKEGQRFQEFIDLSKDPEEYQNQMNDSELDAEKVRLMERMIAHFMSHALP